MTFGIRDMYKMLFRSESYLKNDAWEAVIFLQAQMNLYLHIPQENRILRVKNATSHSATVVTLIFLKKFELYGSSAHRL